MSRIFDALQRSERERSGDDSQTLPQGPDLLKRAEHRAASKWETVETHVGPEVINFAENSETVHTQADVPARTESIVNNSEELPIDERVRALDRLRTLPISLAPQSRLVCLTDRENPAAEAIRLLGVRLKDLRRVRPLKKLLITSTIPQEGKSTIAANLACALAHVSGEKTLLIEGDLRRPSLSQMFGVPTTSGMFELLKEGRSPFKGIYRLADTDLCFMPAGKTSSDPIELLQSEKLPALMEQCAALFDWIVIDSPPVLPLADTSVWSRLADGVLLVTRQGVTEKHQLQKGLEALDQRKLLGALVNGSIASAYSGYYYRSSISS
jgi:capsular exopolysaccharide synthesis family protein